MRAIISKKANKTLQALDQNMREKNKKRDKSHSGGRHKTAQRRVQRLSSSLRRRLQSDIQYIGAENLKVYDIGSRGDIYK